MTRLEVTLLGSGSSGGVPRADGDWGACDPSNPRNRRSRCSLLLRLKSVPEQEDVTTLLVDTSPDLRVQTSAAGVRRLDAILYTHDHADQAHGIDDVRAFFLRQRAQIATYADAATAASLERRFGYVFSGENGYPAICELRPLPPHGAGWRILGPSGAIPVASFEVDHGGVSCCGYRFGPVGYAPDVLRMPPEALQALAGVEVLIVDALRDRPHPTHAHVARALDWIAELKPARAILTNLHIDLDYAELAGRLPPGVTPGFDGLSLETALQSRPSISDNLP